MGRYNDNTRAAEIVRALLCDSRFKFKDQNGYLRQGICPDCGKKELYVSKSEPWRIACGRENKCGAAFTAKDLLPDLFENYLKRYPPTDENPRATADAYLREGRGFEIKRIRGWYDQGAHHIKDTGEFVPTARFYLDPDRTRWWERLIGKTKSDGQKAHFGGKRKADGSLFKGDAWTPPKQKLEPGDLCFITEGVFHAIAIVHTGRKAISAMSCNNLPLNVIEAHKGQGITWVLALDPDRAGRRQMLKHRESLQTMGETVQVCLLPDEKEDWDDLWQKGGLKDVFFESCLHAGRLFTSSSVAEKCWHIWRNHPAVRHLVVDFSNAVYSVKMRASIDDVSVDENEPPELFFNSLRIVQICNLKPTLLYLEKNEVADEQHYVFQVEYKNGTPSKLIRLEGASLAKPDAFNKALIKTTNGGRFSGDAVDFEKLVLKQLDKRIHDVEALDYIGYNRDIDAWVFPKVAYQHGNKISPNEYEYFELPKQSIKTSLQSIEFATDANFSPVWLPQFLQAFSWFGLAALCFFLGSLFAQQIRAKQKSLFFWELTGEAGAGKTTILEFCWKLLCRDDEEGFDINKTSKAGCRRAMSQFSNLPTVIIEADREVAEGQASKQFQWDSLKDYYNGRATGILGVANSGNDVKKSMFKSSILIAQNAEVNASTAILTRIVHCHADKKHHSEETRQIAQFFERQTADDVGGFLDIALRNSKKILDTYFTAYIGTYKHFSQNAEIKTERIVKNHAQMAALAHALKVIFPNLQPQSLQGFMSYLEERAKAREARVSADHPVVEKFWETFHYINEKSLGNILDHAADEAIIAVHLNHFRATCLEYGQELIDMTTLKRHLETSKTHKFLQKNKSVHSKITSATVKCWIFKK